MTQHEPATEENVLRLQAERWAREAAEKANPPAPREEEPDIVLADGPFGESFS